MAELVLPYDRAVVPQEKPWDCGPASTQVVLNSRGIIRSEDDLIRQIGTTVNGTDYVGLIERVLDVIVPDARYTSVYIDHDPATQAEKERLWDNLVRSIRAGYGVVMNWVSPPSNAPRGVKGSASPNGYGRHTVYHYVAAMGYDDTPGQRAVWIADPGFAPFGYWISFDQCATLIPPKGYAFADIGVPAAAPVDPVADVLARVMGGGVSFDRYRELAPRVAASLLECDARTIERIAMWAAQVGHESGGLRWQQEIADGSAYNGRTDLGNTQPGDGPRYKGRDFIQITGRSNYRQLSQWAFREGLVPNASFFEDNPLALATDDYSFLGVDWYWTVARPDINALSDARDLVTVTRRINGGQNGIDDRRLRYDRALGMGAQLLTLTSAPQDELEEILMLAVPSMSIYANPGEEDVPIPVMIAAQDAHGPHEPYVENRARKGIPDDLLRVARTAAGKGKAPYGTTPEAIAQASAVVAEIEATHPEYIQAAKAALAQKGV